MLQSPPNHRNPHDDRLTPELRLTLASASQTHLTSQDELHDAVCHYLDHLRRRGLTRERALRQVREFVSEMHGFTGAAPAKAMDRLPRPMDRMPMLLNDWCNAYWPAS